MSTNQSISVSLCDEGIMSVQLATQIAVRQMSSEDLPALEQMYDSYVSGSRELPPADPILRRYWLEELRRGINLVAYMDGRVAGHLVLVPTSGAAQMIAYVHQDFRCQGVATALAHAAIEEARLDGFHYIWLLIAKGNPAAQRWLQKLGFRVIWQDAREMQFLRSTVG